MFFQFNSFLFLETIWDKSPYFNRYFLVIFEKCSVKHFNNFLFQALKLHIKVVHSMECQSHGCPLCSMKFSVWKSLLRHFLRSHRQFRRYVCGLCGNRYSQNQDLKGHFKSHHNLTLPNIKSTEKKAVNEVSTKRSFSYFIDRKEKQIMGYQNAMYNHSSPYPSHTHTNKSFCVGYKL